MKQAAYQLGELSYRQGATWVLTRLTFTIPTGATVLLTGANGAGKTTLLRLLATALRPTRGTLSVRGEKAWPDPSRARQSMALMTHQHHVYDGLTGRENLNFVARLRGGALADARNIEACLSRVGLDQAADRALRDYSAGMKRRLVLSKLMLLRPTCLLLDEPFGQLDPAGVTLMSEFIAEQQALGHTLVVATHDVARGQKLATHVLHLSGSHKRVRLVANAS